MLLKYKQINNVGTLYVTLERLMERFILLNQYVTRSSFSRMSIGNSDSF